MGRKGAAAWGLMPIASASHARAPRADPHESAGNETAPGRETMRARDHSLRTGQSQFWACSDELRKSGLQIFRLLTQMIDVHGWAPVNPGIEWPAHSLRDSNEVQRKMRRRCP